MNYPTVIIDGIPILNCTIEIFVLIQILNDLSKYFKCISVIFNTGLIMTWFNYNTFIYHNIYIKRSDGSYTLIYSQFIT